MILIRIKVSSPLLGPALLDELLAPPKAPPNILERISFISPKSSDPKLNGGVPPSGPTAFSKDQHELTNAEIEDIIEEFADSAVLAHKTEADGVQLHCAHGYLLSEFLSPALNKRTDKWGGSEMNRLRIVKEIIEEIRKRVSKDFPIAIKMNGNDHIKGGVTPDMAAIYVKSLVDDVDFFEISCGISGNYIIRSRGGKSNHSNKKPEDETTKHVPFTDMYNLDALKVIRKAVPNANLALVGGISRLSDMEKLVTDGLADVISMSRPFVNDPYLVYRLKIRLIERVNCLFCNGCIKDMEDGLYCHVKGK